MEKSGSNSQAVIEKIFEEITKEREEIFSDYKKEKLGIKEVMRNFEMLSHMDGMKSIIKLAEDLDTWFDEVETIRNRDMEDVLPQSDTREENILGKIKIKKIELMHKISEQKYVVNEFAESLKKMEDGFAKLESISEKIVTANMKNR